MAACQKQRPSENEADSPQKKPPPHAGSQILYAAGKAPALFLSGKKKSSLFPKKQAAFLELLGRFELLKAVFQRGFLLRLALCFNVSVVLHGILSTPSGIA